MADDVDLNLPTVPGGKKVASEDIGGKQVQRVKLVLGGFGADAGDVASGNPLPVAGAVTVSGVATATAQATAQTALDAIKVATEASATATGQTTGNAALAAIKTAVEGTIDVAGTVAVASLPSVTIGSLPSVTIGDALPAGANALGSVSVSALPALAAGSNVIGHVVTDSGSTVAVSALPALPAGSNAIGSVSVSALPNVTIGAALPAGDNNIGNVDIVSLPSLPAGSNAIGTVEVTSAPLPSDAATQTTLAAILAALPAALGQALAAACLPVVLPVAQDVVSYAGANGNIKTRHAIVASDKRSTLATTGKLIAASGSALYYYVKNSSGGAIFLQIFNSGTAPSAGDRADGYTVSVSNGGLSNGALGQNMHGIPCPNGVYLVASSTQDTYTAIASTGILYTLIYLQG